MDKEMNNIKQIKSLENIQNSWENLIKRYCNSLNLSKDVCDVCFEIAKNMRILGFAEGQKPATKVATVIAFACSSSSDPKDHRSIDEISLKVGPKSETIQERIKELKVIPAILKIPKVEEFFNKKQ